MSHQFYIMNLHLKDKKAFISGSTQGIGFSIAQALAEEGAAITLNGRDPKKVDQAVSRLSAAYPENDINGVAIDFSQPEHIASSLPKIGKKDILINNVGRFDVKDFFNLQQNDWRNIFEVNVMSGILLTQYLLPGMLAQNTGRIIFISSESGLNVPPGMIHYGMSKAATAAVANGVSKLTKGTNVTVNTVLGGPTYSEGVATAVNQLAKAQNKTEEEMKKAIFSETSPDSLLDRFIEPNEMASLVAYLCSPLSAAINGASLRVDGGVLKVI